MTALLFSLTSPFALLLGYVFLGETITGPGHRTPEKPIT